MIRNKKSLVLLGLICLLWALPAQSLTLTARTLKTSVPETAPSRAVCLVPSAAEILFELGAGDRVAGLTHHDATLKGAGEKPVVGGFFNPSYKKILALNPDLVILSDLHESIQKKLAAASIPVFLYHVGSVEEGFDTITALGKLFKQEGNARRIVEKNRAQIQLIKKKLARAVPEKDKKRVMRLMGREQIMTPGSDSFQNDLIRMAGGIPPDFVKKGQVVTVNQAEWQAFNPEVVYGCGDDKKAADNFFSLPGWKEVSAVKNHQVVYFPCQLTCRAATHTGYFVQWLSAAIYGDAFSKPENEILKPEPVDTRPVTLPLPYVKQAAVVTVPLHDFNGKTLTIDFKTPQTVVSTLQGLRTGITTVGNHYTPPPCWRLGHAMTLSALEKEIAAAVDRDPATSAFLMTGADMDNLSVQTKRFRDMEVTALVTAGVMSNAMRVGRDEGQFYEPGTINIIILTNTALSQRAMTRAIICATEAKTAALEDLDIRSSVAPREYSATGTGTDNVLVVKGEGGPIENSGGHTKMGELISKAVYDGVTQAIFRQNKLTGNRHIFQRLRERHITISGLTSHLACDCLAQKDLPSMTLTRTVEHLLLEKEYAGFLESALALSDAHEKGLVKDLTLFNDWCRGVVQEICGARPPEIRDVLADRDIPVVLKTALNALIQGAMELPGDDE